jgi:transcriptional regulator with XRE-family HTH domain
MEDAARAPDQPHDDEATDRWRQFGLWLQQTRLAKGMNRKDLEHASGLQYSALQRLEDGGRMENGEWLLPNPTDASLQRLANGLGVPVGELYRRAGGTHRERNQGRKQGWARREQLLEDQIAALREDAERTRERVDELEERLGTRPQGDGEEEAG